ncbi:MAG: hypothetical protein CVV27_02025, partial [Candidatus Melainabacteria bacterium HGW-Melainabacteria-1]
LLSACVYGVALLGQRFAQAQMLQLRDFFACTACHPQLEEMHVNMENAPDAKACRVCEKGAESFTP